MLDRLPDDGGGRISSGGRYRICLCLGVSWGSEVLSSRMWVGWESKEGKVIQVVS